MRHTYSWLAAGALLPAALGCRDDAGSLTEPETATPVSVSEATLTSNTWLVRRNMTSERVFFAANVVKNAAGQSIVYAIGGRTLIGGSLGKVQAYNVATDTWTTKAPLPIAVYSSNGVGVIGGKLYISGGIKSGKNFSNQLYSYDPATNVWIRKHDMPTFTYSGVSGTIQGKLYVLTSCENNDSSCQPDIDDVLFYRYDPATDQWTTLPAPANSHHNGVGAVIGGKFYVTAGCGAFACDTRLDVYDPATNAWTTRASLPRPRSLAAGAAMSGKLYVIGGEERSPDGTWATVRTTRVYDPATNSWATKASMPTPRSRIAARAVELNGQPALSVMGGPGPGNNLLYVK